MGKTLTSVMKLWRRYQPGRMSTGNATCSRRRSAIGNGTKPERRLAGHTVLGLDTCVFIYHFEAHPHYLPYTQALLGASRLAGGRQ